MQKDKSLEKLRIRTAKPEDIGMLIDWAASEGWNPGLSDADSFYAADPEGFFIAELDGTPVAVISAVRYGETFGFIGFYIVKQAHRGKGYGIQIWRAAMDSLEGRNIGLDGVLDQQHNYKKSGFELAYRHIRYEGVTGGHHPDLPDGVTLTTLTEPACDIVEGYDQAFFPADRSRFLRRWISQPQSEGFAIRRDDKILGYGVIRRCRTGYKIGPLFADGPELADAIFVALKASVAEGEPFYLDVPEPNRHAMALVQRHAMQAVFETARMYTREHPPMPLDRIFGVTSFELG